MCSRWWTGRRGPTAGMKVMKERSRNRSALGAGRWTVGALPGIGRPGGMPSTYPSGPGPWDEWNSLRGGPPCGRWSDYRLRWGHLSRLRSDGRTWAVNNGRYGSERGCSGMSVVAVVRLGQWGGLAMSTLLGAWDRMVSSIIRPRRRRLTGGMRPLPAPPEDDGGGMGSSPLTRRPMRVLWYEAWRVPPWGGGFRRLGDWGAWVAGR